MTSTELLTDAFGRVHEVVHDAVDGLTPEELAFRVDGSANSIAWLVWHLSRITDDHIAAAAGHEQVWITGGPVTPGRGSPGLDHRGLDGPVRAAVRPARDRLRPRR